MTQSKVPGIPGGIGWQGGKAKGTGNGERHRGKIGESNEGMKHLDVVDGELAAVPVEERPAAGTIGQNIELFILKLRSPDAEVWTACTATAAAVGLDSIQYQEYILLSNGVIQRTPCNCTLTRSSIDQLGSESINITDSSTVRVATVFLQQSYTELACFRSFF